MAPKRSTDGQALIADNAKPQAKAERRTKKNKQKDKSESAGAQANGAAPPKKPKKRSAFSGRAPTLDPLLLARGMSSRFLSSKISHQLTPLPKDDIEKDLRHMEAYRNACNGYAQQLFVFKNQELVRSGYFGTFAPLPGADGEIIQPAVPSAAAKSPFSMPIKIDPEEEKRLSILRKKIHQSEFEREKLETEYLSLRAHYVHESQLVRKTRAYEMGRWELLKELMTRRGKVLGLMRVKIAMGRDIESLLKYRGELSAKVKSGDVETMDVMDTADDAKIASTEMMNGDSNAMATNGEKKADDSSEKANAAVDIVEVWNDINTQLKEAEMACMELETPKVLSEMVAGTEASNGSSSRSRSPTPKGKKRSSSVTSELEAVGNDSGNKKSKGPIPPGLEPHVVPWDCMVEPQTPYEVPLLLSCLSSATDRAVGYGKFCKSCWALVIFISASVHFSTHLELSSTAMMK